MAYGIIKVDTIIFDQGGADQNVTVSGIYRAITSGVTVSGTISGAVLVGTTTVSGTTVTGTTANFASGVFTTQVSGATVTGTQSSFTSGNFVTLSGTTATFTSGVIASGTAAAPSLSILGDPNTGIYSPGADQLAVATSGTRRLDVNSSGQFRIGDGGTVGIFSAQAVANGNLHIRDIASVIGSGTGVALDVLNDAGSAVQDLAIRGTNTIFRNSAGETLRITSAGLVGIGTSSPAAALDIGGTFQSVRTYLSSVTDTYHLYRGTPDSAGFEHARVFSGRDTSVHTYGSYLAFYTEGKSSGTTDTSVERLRIDSSGNVGIGTSSPQAQLQVLDRIKISDSTQAQGSLQLGDGASTTFNVGLARWNGSANAPGAAGLGYFSQGTGNSGGHYFYTGDAAAGSQTARMIIAPGGNVGIGTTSPSSNGLVTITETANARLYLSDATLGSGYGAQLRGYGVGGFGAYAELGVVDADTYTKAITVTDQANSIIFSKGATERARIDSSGRLLVGQSTNPGGYYFVVNTGSASNNNAIQLSNNANAELNINLTSGVSLINANVGILALGISGTERARIDSSGRLLVGTSTARGNFFNTTGQESLFEVESLGGPVGAFTLNNSSGAPGSLVIAKSRGATAGSNVIAQNNDGIGRLSFQASDGSEMVEAANIEAWVDGTPGANDMPGRLVFSTTADGASAPTERMRIDALGALKTSPNGTYKFPAGTTEITHNDATSSVQLIASSTGFTGDAVTISTYRNTVNDSYKFLACIRQGFAVALEIRDDGDVYNVNGTYGSLSDVKLKENIVDANSQWDDIRQLRVRNYNFKPETNNSTHKQIGVIAQEIEDVSPGLVNTVPDRDEDGNDLGTVTKSVNYSVLYMKAVKALQEAMTRIETLEADVALLKSA